MTARLSRRSFLGYSAVAGALASAGTLGAARTASRASSPAADTTAPFRWEEASFAELQEAMEAGELTALSLTRAYMERIRTLDWDGPKVNSVIELNPDAEAIAQALDEERWHGLVRGPLHGIPILLKDLSPHHRARRLRGRAAGRHLVHGPGVGGAETPALRVRLRAGGAGPPPTEVPGGVRREGLRRPLAPR